jgi:PAS domain S-box-containing protein
VKEADRLAIDLDSFLEMYLELALVPKEKLESCANLFKMLTASISHLAKEGSEAKAKISEVLTINDILEKEVENTSHELKESEERYRRIYNSVIDGIFETDMEGRIIDINPGGAKLMGFTRAELIGTMMKDRYVNPDDRREFVDLCLRDGHAECFHPFIRLKNGQTKYFETNAVLIKNRDGKPMSIQGIFRDISPRAHSSIKPTKKDVAPNTALKGNKDDQVAH